MRKILALAVVPFSALAASPAFAQSAATVDYSTLTGAVSFESTITAILAVGALAVTLTLAVVGVKKILRMIRSA